MEIKIEKRSTEEQLDLLYQANALLHAENMILNRGLDEFIAELEKEDTLNINGTSPISIRLDIILDRLRKIKDVQSSK